jgi:hypothetical protein
MHAIEKHRIQGRARRSAGGLVAVRKGVAVRRIQTICKRLRIFSPSAPYPHPSVLAVSNADGVGDGDFQENSPLAC